MSTIFDSIAVRSLPESVFDLSHEVKLSGNMGELIPIMLEEVIPGDTFQVQSEIMIRLAPMLAPVMHRVQVFTHYFYVPNRLVWDNFHDHITGGEDGTANPVHPQVVVNAAAVTAGQVARGTLADYLGLPTFESGTTLTEQYRISALPFRGYQLIFNEYYRDQDLSQKITINKGDGDETDLTELLKLRTRHWQRDYFTSARPSPQKGPQVTLPNVDVVYKQPSQFIDNNGTSETIFLADTGGRKYLETQGPAAIGNGVVDNIESIGAVTIEDQRRANRLQEWLELAQRGGSRINEIIRNFFGVVPDDLRLTRPQYLGGGMQNVIMSEVLNTAADQDPSAPGALAPLGDYGGHGISVGNQNGFRERFKEHGYVFGIMSVIPKTAYQQGIHKHWTKFDKYEKYWPQFANIGEQEITQQELYIDAAQNDAARKKTFGYAPRYSEYKYSCDRVAGDFRKDSGGDNLSYWHMGRYFDSEPQLNQQFVEADPTHRIFAVTDDKIDKLYVQIYHKFKAKRKMPYHNIPSNMPV